MTRHRERVEAVLDSASESQALMSVSALDSAVELHELALAYNWDDGFAVPSAILQHKLCERATALHLYYAAQGPWSTEEGVSPEHGAFLRRAKEALLSGAFPEGGIPYDPVAQWELSQVQVLKLRRGGFPEALLRGAGPQ